MKKGIYLAILFISISLSSLVSASEIAFTTKSTSNAIPESENLTGSSTLVTLPISGAFCSGSTIVVNFNNNGFVFGSGNVMNAELSNASGDFSSPTSISISPLSFEGNASDGFVYALIPNGTPSGSGYRIRVTSSNPVSVATDNGSDITITNNIAPATPTVIQSGPSAFCYGAASTFLTSSAAQNNLWFPGGVNTNPFIGVVSEGCYYTQVSGNNGCATSSLPICIQVNTPIFTYLGYFENNNLVSTTDTTITICEGDSAQIGFIIEGGTPPYNIFYTPNGNDIITLNGVGVPFNSVSYFHTFNVSTPGFYQLLGIEDAFITPCGSAGNSGLVTIQNSPAPITSFSYNPFCGPVSQAPVGDAGFVSGGVYSFDETPSDVATIDATTGIISNATIGNTYFIRYTVAVAFCNGSIRTSTTSITVSPTDITSFNIAPFCNNGSSLAPVGAIGFATGGIYSFQTAPSDAAQIDPSTGIISNASANTTYIIVYTSPAGTCQNNSSASVTTFESPSVTANVQNTLCGQSTGSINVTVSGGLSPYTYLWSNSSTDQDISAIASGAYSLSVNDGNGCSIDTSFTIIDSNKPELELIATNTSCGNSNGAINLNVTAGSGNYSYLWTPGDISSVNISGLVAGSYSVEVTDLATTCVVTGSSTIANQDAPTVTSTKVDATCNQSDGSIDVTVDLNGGSSTISHHWSNGSTSEDLTGLSAGTYIDTVRDGNGCEVIISVTISNSNQFTATSSLTNPTCGNANGGAIDISIEGGEAPFTFNWSPNTTDATEDVSGLAAGEYTVIITDAASCSTSVSSSILPASNILLSSSITLATCGNTDGAIDINVTGASGVYTYLWNNSATTPNIALLDTGSYSVTVTDITDLTCTANLTVEITYGNLPTIGFVTGPVSCTVDNGSVNLTVLGGSSNYSFVWSGPNSFSSNDQNIADLAAGLYSVTVSDNTSSCIISGSALVEPVNAPSLSANVANTTCGQENGVIDITISGGTSPFTIDWSNGGLTQDQINLPSGDYSLTITDENGCSIDTLFTILPSNVPYSEISVIQPICSGVLGEIHPNIAYLVAPVTYNWTKDGIAFANTEVISELTPGLYALVATDINGCAFSIDTVLAYPNQPVVETSVTNTLCGLSTGAIDITVTEGLPEYTFSWSNDNGFTSTQENISGLAYGCYSVTVTDANGCEVTAQACIENDNAPLVSFNSVNPSCNLDNGSISALVSAGVYPYSYSWGTIIADTDSVLTDLQDGDYTITVTDANGCFVSESVTLVNTGIPVLTVNSINASCGNSDGSIELFVSGGVSPYSFLWSPNGETTEDIISLPAGNYSVVLTDDAGCEASGNVTIENSDAPQLSYTSVNALCGLTNGSIDLTVSGGSNDFSFSWTDLNNFTSSSEDLSGLSAGIYTVIVTDNVYSCSDSLTVTIQSSNGFTVEASLTPTSCNLDNGAIALTITGGTSPFSFEWSNGQSLEDLTALAAGTYDVIITDNVGCESNQSYTIVNTPSLSVTGTAINVSSCGACDGSIVLELSNEVLPVVIEWSNEFTTSTITNLCAGEYSANVTDANGCIVTYSTTITGGGSAITILPVQLNVTCGQSNGSIDITVSGGSSNFGFAWSGPDGFSSTSEDISSVAEGNYTLVITDLTAGCDSTITFNITNSSSFSVEALATAASCNQNNGSVTLILTGEIQPLTFLWCDGQTTQNVTGLAPGTCSVTVTDGTGCAINQSVTIGNLPGLTISSNATDATCGLCNGTIQLQLTNAASPITYLWSNGASTSTITNLCSGDYSVTVTDANGCSDSYSTSISGGTSPDVTSIQTNSECGSSIGAIDITVVDGALPYSFSWTGPLAFTASTEDITGISAGAYSVVVTDALGCTANLSATIINTNDPVLAFATTNTSCGASAGAIDLTVNVVVGPGLLTYVWTGPNSFNSTDEDITGLNAGTYSVIVSLGACSVTGDTTIINTDAPSASISLSDNEICANDSINLNVDITGNGPFTFVYSNGISNFTETLSSAGTFSVAVNPSSTTTYTLISLASDIDPTCAGSFTVSSASVTVNSLPSVPTISASGPLSFCEGGSVILTSSFATGNIWNQLGPDQLNQSITVTESGTYYVTVTNSFGCSDSSVNVLVDVIGGVDLSALTDTTICAGYSIQLQATGADSYLWSPSIYLSGTIIANPVCTPMDTTTYIVTGTNSCGVSTDTIVVSTFPIVNVNLGDDQTVCPGQTINLSVENIAGATYTWEPAGYFIGSDSTSSVSFISTVNTSIVVTSTNVNGCVSSDTLQINIITPPAAPVITAQGPTTFCEGDNVVLQSSTGNFVIWSNGLENFNQILVTTSGSYYVTSVDGICPATSDTIVVTVNPTPAASFTLDGDSTICEGSCVNITADQTTNFSWLLPDTSVLTTQTIAACSTGVYSLSVTENGCVGTETINIIVAPLPALPVITLNGPDVICEGESALLQSSYATGNQWSIDGATIAGSVGNAHLTFVGGLFTVTYTNGLGCSATSLGQLITIKPTSPLVISASSDTLICGNNPQPVLLTASPGFITYDWSTNEVTDTITISTEGVYTVTGTNQYGCETTSSITFVIAPNFELDINSPVYFDDYNVTINGGTDGSINLTVNPIATYTYSWSNGQSTEDLSNIPAGSYTVTVTNEFGCSEVGSIVVKEPEAIKLPNTFSPNGDGYNDFYVIKGIQGYPNSQLDIFNRWGNLVYSKKGYTNDWNGVSNNGNELPDGTYFIVVDLNMEGKENVKGSIDIKRK